MTHEDLLLENVLEEHEDIVFIRPHAQFPVFRDGTNWDWASTPDAASLMPEMNRFIELIGRTCYKSEDRITDTSAGRFLKMLVSSGHESVIEHLTLTVKFVGSRAMSHQLVRHRLAAFSQESQRYVNYGKGEKMFAVMPPGIFRAGGKVKEDFVRGINDACKQYIELLSGGVKPEDARSLLPNAVKTEIVMSTNLRQWRHVVEERGLNSRAQWEIRTICLQVLEAFNGILPEVFGDLWVMRNNKIDVLTADTKYD